MTRLRVDPVRRCRIATIKIAQQQLGMDDATYRAMLQQMTGKTSATALDPAELNRVIDHLVKCGAVIKRSPKRRGAPSTLDRNAQYGKIEALLADMRLPWAYADRIAEHITGGKSGGIQRLGWVKESKYLQAVIAALTIEQEKRALLADVDRLLAAVGKTRDAVAAKVRDGVRTDWTRNRAALKQLRVLIPQWWPQEV